MNAATLVTVAALAISIVAQSQVPVFKSRRESVRLDVLVSDRGRPVLGLQAADFTVLDNGVPQQIEFVSFDETPLNVVLTFDVSGSVTGQRHQDLRAAGHAVLSELRKDDRAAFVAFSHTVSVGSELTHDFAGLRSALDRNPLEGQTSLADAAFAGLVVGTSDTGRSLMLVFSDGQDTASWLPESTVTDAARRADVVVFGVSTSRIRPPFLKDLVEISGGELVEIRSTTDLQKTFLRLLAEYRQRYLIGYSPSGVAGDGWHKVSVSVPRRGVAVTTRQGYQRR